MSSSAFARARPAGDSGCGLARPRLPTHDLHNQTSTRVSFGPGRLPRLTRAAWPQSSHTPSFVPISGTFIKPPGGTRHPLPNVFFAAFVIPPDADQASRFQRWGSRCRRIPEFGCVAEATQYRFSHVPPCCKGVKAMVCVEGLEPPAAASQTQSATSYTLRSCAGVWNRTPAVELCAPRGWSGWRATIPRPQRPERCALPNCATPRCGQGRRLRSSGLAAPSRALCQAELYPVVGLRGVIRTRDPRHPMTVLYQAEPHEDVPRAQMATARGSDKKRDINLVRCDAVVRAAPTRAGTLGRIRTFTPVLHRFRDGRVPPDLAPKRLRSSSNAALARRLDALPAQSPAACGLVKQTGTPEATRTLTVRALNALPPANWATRAWCS